MNENFGKPSRKWNAFHARSSSLPLPTRADANVSPRKLWALSKCHSELTPLWIPVGRSGDRPKWVPDRNIPGRSPPHGSWELTGSEGHWDIDDGLGERRRYDLRGAEIPDEEQHKRNYRRKKSGPGSRCLAVGAGAVFAGTVACAQGLDAMANNGTFTALAAAASRGEDIDDMVFDAALDTALETGNAGAFYGLYGGWFWANQAAGK